MEMEQELEWLEAQKMATSLDLLAAAKRQLQFLAAVDKNRWLYEGPTLECAIYRYNACWLPLLAKHSESPVFEGPLVVPLDCEWVWHCHRLNPVRYKNDSEELFGRILDNSNVVSSVQGGICIKQTQEIWNKLYPDEPYNFDLTRALSTTTNEKFLAVEKYTNYDLVSAVKRQSPFYYQVCRPHFNNDIFLDEAVARYKGFLYLIKRNGEQSIKRFCVPTYDIDLIWHTHQLHPIFYCKDLSEALGKILEHDDMDPDRTKGKKLDIGFSGTTKQWEETFGTRYWKAGAMYSGRAPSPLTTIPFLPNLLRKDVLASNECQKMIQLPEVKIVEVLLEFVSVKNLPEGHKGCLFVRFSKKQPDVFFNAKQKLTILSESEEKQVASFQCEPKGELIFELISHSPSNLLVKNAFKTMGTASLSLQDFVNPISKLSIEKRVELLPSSGNLSSKPICLQIAVSFTVPIQAPYVLHMVHSQSLSKSSCLFPFPVQHAKIWTHINDEYGSEIISLQMRDSAKGKTTEKSILKKQVVGAMKSGETRALAEFMRTHWSLMDSQWCLKFKTKSDEDGHFCELIGSRMIKIFHGRKLDFEPKHCEKQRNKQDFLTAVEFSAEDPYGKAVALLDFKSATLMVKEEWLVLPAIVSSFILADILKNKRYGDFIIKGENLEKLDGNVEKVSRFHEEAKQIKQTTSVESKLELNGNAIKSGGCGSGCGGGCRNMVKSGGCGGSCGGVCGNVAKSGGCGGSCGGGCANVVKSGGCGGSCGGGGCGNVINNDGNGLGGMVESADCGGCGASCVDKTSNETNIGNSHIDSSPIESPTYATEAIV
ncbi:hypothetical protein P3X46_012674 [Hevea brasiliensis]|uniref:Glycine-rich domain-containing protein-like n=2 Tax=Hevea brasiliensis TaxID=3981 RepID=A0ABQ9MEL3_HEVBR|nr:hypothetical protein P3X46_012674 [Hevea brasiliensis]